MNFYRIEVIVECSSDIHAMVKMSLIVAMLKEKRINTPDKLIVMNLSTNEIVNPEFKMEF